MSVKILIPPPLRRFTSGADSLEASVKNLPDLINKLEENFPGIRKSICGDDGTLHRFINVYVNDEDIRFLGGADYKFQENDEVSLIPSIAGGCCTGGRKVEMFSCKDQ
ncbi:MAG: MoaD/ThiS family protein [Acidobacteria bacterium]|nr:MoaD/ThiS family protein [Acidobacteriota bacterium]